MPRRWAEAARWYRRASRERRNRVGVGAVVAAILQALRDVGSADGLREPALPGRARRERPRRARSRSRAREIVASTI